MLIHRKTKITFVPPELGLEIDFVSINIRLLRSWGLGLVRSYKHPALPELLSSIARSPV